MLADPQARSEDRGRPGLEPDLHAAAYATIVSGVVALALGVPSGEIRAPSRRRAEIAFARQIAMYLTHTCYGISLTQVGAAFGRDRTTASHACHVVEDARDHPQTERLLKALEKALEGVPKLRPAPFWPDACGEDGA